jgi:hypothetical protein
MVKGGQDLEGNSSGRMSRIVGDMFPATGAAQTLRPFGSITFAYNNVCRKY